MRRGLRPNTSSVAKVIMHAFQLAKKQLISCIRHSRAAAWCHLDDKPKQHRQGHDNGPSHAVPGCRTPCLTIILLLSAWGCLYTLQPQPLVVMPLIDYMVVTA